ncbi:RsmE family RNA methyltransferase [Candidatus Avelusimicrobium stercoris]|mgnify:FL=1|uniref:RsmE family RNA methyltransferase n=1 Tax=Candidatus Avelusimicrobium stercoris TaxID=1947924 RepID=UPI003D100C68
MPQYFADIKETEFFLTDAEAHHASAVARHKEGDEIRVFDGTGKQFMARIDRVQKKFIRGTLLKPCEVRRVPLELELCFAPNSRTGLEEVLDKGTQLGVAAFRPIMTERSEYDVLKKWDGKNDRWHQIMIAACKQCDTPFVPEILPPVKFPAALVQEIPSLIAYEAEETHTLQWGLEKLGNPKRLRVFVGPAGGWTDEEIVVAAQYNVLPVTLGVNILRAETACIAVAAKLL